MRLGEILHIGQGVEVSNRRGFEYGQYEYSTINVSGHFLLYHGEYSIGMEGGWYEGNARIARCRRCFTLLPVLTNPEIRAPLHAADVELEVMLPFIGFSIGFSPGQFLDFILGYFGVDLDRPRERVEGDRQPGQRSPIWKGKAEEQVKTDKP